MKYLRIISYLSGIIIFCIGLMTLKTDFIPGAVIVCAGLLITAIVDLIPEPKVKKLKLSTRDIEEIIHQADKDAIEREVKFLNKERDKEIINTVADWDFEESLIALHTIEKTHPNLTTGKGVQI